MASALDIGDGKEINLEKCLRSKLHQLCIKYLGPGLLASKMYEAAKGIVTNLVSLIDLFGYVLNGSRAYYSNRRFIFFAQYLECIKVVDYSYFFSICYSERLTQAISQQSCSVSDELEKDIVGVKTVAQLVKSMQIVGLGKSGKTATKLSLARGGH